MNDKQQLEPRFYTGLNSEKGRDVEGWTEVVDEERGGVIAYFGDEAQAIAFVRLLSSFPLIDIPKGLKP